MPLRQLSRMSHPMLPRLPSNLNHQTLPRPLSRVNHRMLPKLQSRKLMNQPMQLKQLWLQQIMLLKPHKLYQGTVQAIHQNAQLATNKLQLQQPQQMRPQSKLPPRLSNQFKMPHQLSRNQLDTKVILRMKNKVKKIKRLSRILKNASKSLMKMKPQRALKRKSEEIIIII